MYNQTNMSHNFQLFFLLLLPTIVFAQKEQKVEPAFSFLKRFPNVRDFTLSAAGNEAYFTVQSPLEELGAVACIKEKAGRWSEPVLVHFTGRWRDIEPFLAPNELRLYFSSNRPHNDSSTQAADYDIWYVERKTVNSEWSEPVNLGAPVNSDRDEFYPSLSLNGNLYFTSERADSKCKDDIYVSQWAAGRYSEPHSLDTTINSDGYEFNAFVAPDESYLLYTGYNRKDGLGSGDLYASFRGADGRWLPAVSLGEEVNSKQMDYCPFVDARSGVLYFTSRRSIVPATRFTSLKAFEETVSGYENGFSRIYKVPIQAWLQKARAASVR